MSYFDNYITAEQAYEMNKELNPESTLEDWKKRAKMTEVCTVCGMEEVWRYGGTDMCFHCTTGESDTSEDYELTAE